MGISEVFSTLDDSVIPWDHNRPLILNQTHGFLHCLLLQFVWNLDKLVEHALQSLFRKGGGNFRSYSYPLMEFISQKCGRVGSVPVGRNTGLETKRL